MQPGDRVYQVCADLRLIGEGCIRRGPFGSRDLCEVYWGTSDGKPIVTTVPQTELRHASR